MGVCIITFLSDSKLAVSVRPVRIHGVSIMRPALDDQHWYRSPGGLWRHPYYDRREAALKEYLESKAALSAHKAAGKALSARYLAAVATLRDTK